MTEQRLFETELEIFRKESESTAQFFYGYETGGVKQIFPAEIIGISRHAFFSASQTRDWLTDAEANSLCQLITASKRSCEGAFAMHSGITSMLAEPIIWTIDGHWSVRDWKHYCTRTAAEALIIVGGSGSIIFNTLIYFPNAR